MLSALTYPASTRPLALGVNGMVASAHPLASQAGLRVLMEGGNAFDAAVSTAATLGVVEPFMSGVGGIGTALVRIAREGRVRALNFSGRAPLGIDVSAMTGEKRDTGALSSLIPGNVAGWLTWHAEYGSMDLQRLFAPAVGYAEGGIPVTYFNARVMAATAPRLSGFAHSARIILDRKGRAPIPGSRLKMPQLAQTLREIASGGKDVFYRGSLAERIVAGNRDLGGVFSLEDLATYDAQWQEPIRISYRGKELLAHPPNSSGFQILQTLKLMEGFSGGELSYQSPQALHLFIEAVKLCVTDRIKYSGDPDYVKAPIAGLLSDRYAARQRRRIDRERVSIVSGERYAVQRPDGALTPGSPEEFDGGMTTHFAVADRDGNVVSVTQTLGGGFGCAAAMGDTGVFLNNMMYWFDLEEGSPNVLAPGKRVDFVVSPVHVLQGDNFLASMGTPGSWGILQTTPQFLMNLLDLGMDVQQAIEAPRLRVYAGTDVEMEERFPLHVRRTLGDMGHGVRVVEAYSASVGGAQGIRLDPDSGVFQGGADPRRDGAALGW